MPNEPLTNEELDAAQDVAENTDLFDSELMSVGRALRIIAQAREANALRARIAELEAKHTPAREATRDAAEAGRTGEQIADEEGCAAYKERGKP